MPESLNQARNCFLQALIIIVKVDIMDMKIKGVADIGIEIDADKRRRNDHAQNQTENGNHYRPFGGAGALDALSARPGQNAEHGKKNAEKYGITAENGDDGHDSHNQSG